MTPHDRLYTCVSIGVPDRVPFVPKIWVDLGARLTGTDLVEVVEEPRTALRVIADAGLQLGVDAVRQLHFPARRIERQGDNVFEVAKDGRRIGKIDMEGGLTTQLFDQSDYHISDPVMMAHYHHWSPPGPAVVSLDQARQIAVPNREILDQLSWAQNQQGIREHCAERLALIADCSSATMSFLVCMRGLENAMFDLIEEPELVHAVMEKGVAIAVAKGKYWLDQGYKILRLNDSVGNMSLMSPKHWREYVFPHMKTVCDELHAYDSEARVYCHICGNVLPILNDLVETGLDCIGPLDPLGGFTCAEAREIVDDRIALMGGVNTLSFINRSPEEIAEEAVACMYGAGQKGGYVLGSGCVVPRAAKRECLEALVEVVRQKGAYRNGRLREDSAQSAA